MAERFGEQSRHNELGVEEELDFLLNTSGAEGPAPDSTVSEVDLPHSQPLRISNSGQLLF